MNNRFHAWAFQNFPFMESTFKEIDNYHLMMQILHYLKEQLKDYRELVLKVEELENWFNNLDVQEEINNKIDEMVESGELQEIISIYLNSIAIFGFDTVSNMTSSANLINGSYARTCGKNTFNDGFGALYKIRNIINTDIVDGENLIAMNDDSLVAEKIKNYKIEILDSDQYLFIGDSYGMPSENNNWVNSFIAKAGLTLGTNAFNFCRGAAGFISDGTNTYYNNLVNNISSIPDKNKIKHVIIAGGWNDRGVVYNNTDYTSISTLATYIKTNFPNAKIYCGMICNYNAVDDQAENIYWRDVITNQILRYYKACEKYGITYLNGVETVMRNYTYFKDDDVHPNQEGAEALGNAIYQAFNGGIFENYKAVSYMSINQASSYFTLASNVNNTTTNVAITNKWLNNQMHIRFLGTILFNNAQQFTSNSISIPLAGYTKTLPFVRYVDENSVMNCKLSIKDTSNVIYYINGKITFNRTGVVYLQCLYGSDISGKQITSISIDEIVVKDLMYV
jgi:lysophospholipase L1-like esterase